MKPRNDNTQSKETIYIDIKPVSYTSMFGYVDSLISRNQHDKIGYEGMNIIIYIIYAYIICEYGHAILPSPPITQKYGFSFPIATPKSSTTIPIEQLPKQIIKDIRKIVKQYSTYNKDTLIVWALQPPSPWNKYIYLKPQTPISMEDIITHFKDIHVLDSQSTSFIVKLMRRLLGPLARHFIS